MSTHVVGYRQPDDTWNKMKAVYAACVAANAPIPDVVVKFFNYENPMNFGVEGIEVNIKDAVTKWSTRDCAGYKIELSKLPKDIKFILAYNAY